MRILDDFSDAIQHAVQLKLFAADDIAAIAEEGEWKAPDPVHHHFSLLGVTLLQDFRCGQHIVPFLPCRIAPVEIHYLHMRQQRYFWVDRLPQLEELPSRRKIYDYAQNSRVSFINTD